MKVGKDDQNKNNGFLSSLWAVPLYPPKHTPVQVSSPTSAQCRKRKKRKEKVGKDYRRRKRKGQEEDLKKKCAPESEKMKAQGTC
jgi:hypothetical protein